MYVCAHCDGFFLSGTLLNKKIACSAFHAFALLSTPDYAPTSVSLDHIYYHDVSSL